MPTPLLSLSLSFSPCPISSSSSSLSLFLSLIPLVLVALTGPGTPYDASPPLATSSWPVAWLASLGSPPDSLNLQFQVASNATTTTGRPLPLYILHIINYQSLSLFLSLPLSPFLPPSLSLSLGSLLLHGSSHPTRAAASFRGLIFLSFFLSFRAEASFLARGLARNTRQMFRRAPALVISSPLSAGRREQSRREIGKVG